MTKFLYNILKSRLRTELPPETYNHLLQAFRKESYQKKEIIFSEGDRNTRHYFIESGLLRLYLINSQGKEFNVLFARENQVIGDLATPAPTRFYLETIEKSVIWSIADAQLNNLFSNLKSGEGVASPNIMRRSYVKLQDRLVNIMTRNAEENYAEFVQEYPDLLQRIPQYHIASYLGISAEFLSKIRAHALTKK